MRGSLRRFCVIASALLPLSAWAGTAVPFTINLSKPVNVVTSGGTPRIAVDVGGTTRYANYTSGSGTSALTFTYQMQAGDVDLDGVAVSSPVQLNGGTIKDLSGNPLSNLTFTPPNTSGVKVNYPSLGMDFTNGAGGRYTLNGTPYTTLASFLTAAGGSFTRASVGTYYDSAGVLQTASANTPRLDYDPVTHAAKGILIEEARTNLLTRSSEFDDGVWQRSFSLVSANAANAPDGTMTADRFYENTTNQEHYIHQVASFSAGNKVVTAYVKANGSTTPQIQIYSGVPSINTMVTFDLIASTATINTTNGTISRSASISNVGNGWYRIVYIFNSVAAATAEIRYHSKAGFYTGDGTSGIYIWGAQLEQGAFPTSYIPTTTAAVTRAADVLTVPTGSWFNASAGTQMANFYAPSVVSGTNRVVGYNGGGCMLCFTGSTQIWWDGNALSTSNTITSSVLNRSASSFTPSTKATVLNGATVATGAIGTAPSIASATNFYLGSQSGGSNFLNGTIAKFKHYPASVPNTQLQLMTQ